MMIMMMLLLLRSSSRVRQEMLILMVFEIEFGSENRKQQQQQKGFCDGRTQEQEHSGQGRKKISNRSSRVAIVTDISFRFWTAN